MLERELEEKLKKELEKRGALFLKFTSPSMRGVPDRLVLSEGKVWFVEMKRPGKKLRKLQEKIIEKMQTFGAQVRVVDSLESMNRFLLEVSASGED